MNERIMWYCTYHIVYNDFCGWRYAAVTDDYGNDQEPNIQLLQYFMQQEH